MDLLVVDREHALDDERALELGRDHPGTRWTPSSTIDQPSSSARCSAASTPVEHVARLVEEAEQRRVARLLLLGLRQPEARLEARVVDRGHELLREERPHRLADEVGRGDARDPEPVRDLGRDGGLAGAGAAADEQDHRLVELLQVAEAPQAADRARPGLLAEQVDGELAQPVEVDRELPALRQVGLRAPRELVRPLLGQPDRDESARQDPFEYGVSGPPRK